MIVAISGTPAVGKTSVARELGRMLGWRVVNLNKFAREKRLFCGHDEERECDIVDVDMVRKLLREEIRGNENVIVESHYAHSVDSDMLFILRAEPGELRRRARAKGWPERKVEENVLAETMGVCVSEAMDEGREFYEIDTTGKSAGDVAREILKAIREEKGD